MNIQSNSSNVYELKRTQKRREKSAKVRTRESIAKGDAWKINVSATRADVERFQAMADRGEIEQVAVVPLATVFAAMRRAVEEIGRGYLPLDAFFEALPTAYRDGWLSARIDERQASAQPTKSRRAA